MKKITLFHLTWPIFVEFVLILSLGFVDTLMLSQYSDFAAGAVSSANQVAGFLNILLLVTAGGAGILIAQCLGAMDKKQINRIIPVSMVMNLAVGLIISFMIGIFSPNILGWLDVSPDLYPYALTYLRIVGSFMFLQALMSAMSVILKTHGHTKVIMYISLLMNVMNVFLDAAFIFGFLGFPVLGVKGVAIATVASRLVATVLMGVYMFKTLVPLSVFKHIKEMPFMIVKKILKIGLPATMENMSFNMTGLVLTAILFRYIGQDAVITHAYTSKIFMFSLAFSFSIAQSTQIMVGHMIGGKDFKLANSTTHKHYLIGVALTIMAGTLMVIFRYPLIGLFTDDVNILALGATVIVIDAFLEPGRAFNLIYISALRAAGDVYFPLIVGIIIGWSVRIGVGFILAIPLGLGYPGFILAMLIDEWTRGLMMLMRFRSGRWKKKRLI